MGQDQRDGSGQDLQAVLFRELTRALPGFVSCCDRQRRIVYINRTMSRDVSELVGRRIEEFIDPERREVVIACVEDAFTSGEPREVEYAIVLNTGALRHIHTRVLPFRGPSGDEFVLALTEDVSERKRLVEALEHSVEFRRRVIEHLPDYVVLVDREYRMVWVNRVAPTLTFADVIGKRIDEIGPYDPNRERVFRAAFEQRAVGQYEIESYGDGKSTAWYLVRVVPIVVDGKVEHVLVITSDITERKRAEQALRKTEEQLHQAQRLESVGQLAGGVAHDFNNLLQIIQGNLFFVERSLKQGKLAREELEQAQRATERGAELTSHLLAIGRRKRVDSKRVELGELVTQSVRMLRRVIPESIQVVYAPPDTPFFVELDAPQFEQVLINLCVNARDAMAQGGALTIRIAASGTTHVLISVADTGTGIVAEDLPRVFEPFFTTKGAGSGLGLAVAAGIVSAHGGVITAESDGQHGTTMNVRLPLVAPEVAPPAPAPARSSTGSGLILVAEDEELVRSQLVRTLESAGYTVLQAGHGLRAVELFHEHRDRIDLVILDVVMPELDGWQAYLRIREMKPRVRVLFTTGYAASVLPKDFAAHGARLLSKPYKPQVLLAQIRELLDSATV